MINPSEIKMSKNEVLGAREFYYKHCRVALGMGCNKEDGKWATVYLIDTAPEFRGQGEATALLERLKYDLESHGYKFALWCPMSPPIEHICKKLGIAIV